MHLRASLRRWTLFLGVLQVVVGCLVGLIPPAAVLWFRGIVMAHLELTANGVLMIGLGLLINELELGAGWLKTLFVGLQLGTWSNGASGLVAAFLGASSKLLPSVNAKFPAPNGLDHPAVTGLLVMSGVAILGTLSLFLVGLFPRRRRPAATAAVIT